MRYENGFTPMHWAAQHGRRDLVEFIRAKVVGAPSKQPWILMENVSIISIGL